MLRVADVHVFEGRIACDVDSRSEIVLPLVRNGELIGVLDLVVGGVGGWFGQQWTVAGGMGYVFYPFTIAMGVPASDAHWASELLGLRLMATELAAYPEMAKLLATEGFSYHPRTPVILAYALCGFANVASLAIFIGGYAALAPKRRADLVAVGPRALLAATLACLITGAVAGAK